MRERDHLDFEIEQRRRRLLGPVKKQIPWYSLNNNRNLLIIAVFLSGLMFFKPISDMVGAVKSGYRLYNEQEKFKKKLGTEMIEHANISPKS